MKYIKFEDVDLVNLTKLLKKYGIEITLTNDEPIVKEESDFRFVMSRWSEIIYPISQIKDINKDMHMYVPSTQADYIEQLNEIAFKLFGNIKNGDKFNRSNLNIKNIKDIAVIDESYPLKGFVYYEDSDVFQLFGNIIYKNGIWAEKIVEDKPIKVVIKLKEIEVSKPFRGAILSASININFEVNKLIDVEDMEEFITKQINNYLNK